MSDQDQELETIDIAEGDEDEQIELDVDIANGESNEPYEIDPADEIIECREATPPPPAKDERERSRSRSLSRKDDDKEDFSDSELDSNVDITEVTEDADLDEKDLLNMPAVKTLLADISHLKTERRVMVHPLDWNDLHHPAILQTAARDSCEEVKLCFVRPKDNPDSWNGILDIHFTSSRAAKESAEDLKTIREDIVVKNEIQNEAERTYVEKWIKTEKGQKRWTDGLLLIRNIPEEMTLDELKEVINDAEDVVFAKKESKRKDGKKTRMAYAIYRTAEASIIAASNYALSCIEVGGLILKIHKYQPPVDNPPRGLLKLFERRVVLKYLEIVTKRIDNSSEELKAPEWCEKRQKMCTSLIEQDNKCREDLGLPTPSLEELRANAGVKVLRGSKRYDLLVRLRVIVLKPRSSFNNPNSRNDKRKRDFAPSTNSRSLLGNPPSLLNLNMRAVPLSLLMQQSSAGFMGVGDRRNLIGAGEPANKMLRLDSSGNFHLDFNRGKDARTSRSGGSGRFDRR